MNPVYPIKAVVAPQKPQFSMSLTASFLRWGEVGKHKKTQQNATKNYCHYLCLALMRFVYICTFLLALLGSTHAMAQAVPDTSMNQVIPDAARAHADSVHASDTIPQNLGTGFFTDTLSQANDSISLVLKPKVFEPNPKKAGLYSAILPGAGQLYNRQYWKLPIVAAIVGGTGYLIVKNNEEYRKWRRIYVGRLDLDPNTNDNERYSTVTIKQLQDDAKRKLDMSVLYAALGYMVQVMDAVASAHLKNFDISRDISMQFKPMVHPNGMGFGLAMNFK
jgi:hypothetical protein